MSKKSKWKAKANPAPKPGKSGKLPPQNALTDSEYAAGIRNAGYHVRRNRFHAISARQRR